MDERAVISRRKLLGASVGVVAAAALQPKIADAKKAKKAKKKAVKDCVAVDPANALLPPERIGIQLYTVRDQITNVGFAKTFEALAKMGFTEVEFAGLSQGNVGPITPKQIRRLLDSNGLRGIGMHSGANPTNIEQILDDAEILGLPFVGLANPYSAPFANSGTVEQWKQSAAVMNQLGAASAKRGIKFYWHNHADAFGWCSDSPTTRVYDVLQAETDPKLVFNQMDIYWAYVGQFQYSRPPLGTFDPIDYVTKNRARFPLFHVKDGKQNTQSYNGYDFADVGQGHIDFKAFFKKVGQPLRHHYLNERDDAAGRPRGSLESARCSASYMRLMTRD